MLSSVLRSERALQVNVAIMRTFVRMRQLVASQSYLAARLAELERKVGTHDVKIKQVFDLLYELLEPPTEEEKRGQIGFGASAP